MTPINPECNGAGECMDAQTAKTIIGHDRALFLFTLGWLVVAEDMAARLVSSGYFVDEKALLDPASEPRRKGLPVIEVAGVAGLFFRPSAVLGFMKAQAPPARESGPANDQARRWPS